MNSAELLDLLRDGEDSTVAFKRDDARNHDLARELVAFLNLEGVVVPLGVEDDGGISGATRDRLEEWAVELCRSKAAGGPGPVVGAGGRPGRDVLAVRVPVGPDKPYARVHDNRRIYYVRVGSISREASREDLERIYQASGRLRYGLKPAPGAGFDALDLRRLRDYLTSALGGDAPTADDRLGDASLQPGTDDGVRRRARGHGRRSAPFRAGAGEIPAAIGRARSAVRASNPATRPAPTKTCAAPWRPWRRWGPPTAPSSRADPSTGRGTSCAATPRRRPASKARAGSTAGNTRKASSGKPW